MKRGLTLFLAILPAAAFAQTAFLAPQKITDSAANYQFSRTASNLAAFDSEGTLHLTYFSGQEVTNPSAPSTVYYRSWAPSGWSSQVVVDHALQGATRIGARHPSLAIAPDDAVWIAWEDHRHGSSTFSYIDNNEVYANSKPAGGSFAASDIRLTTSTAGPPGDNAYTPKIVSLGDGRLSVLWYDFTANFDVADLYLKTSSNAGVFDTGESMASMRLTNETARSGAPSFTVPDVAVDASGTLHVTWATGEGAIADLYYGSVTPGGTLSQQLLAAGVASYFDPPRIAVAPGGDVWIANGDGTNKVTLRRKPAASSTWDSPIDIATQTAPSAGPTMAFADSGDLHLAWVDERSGSHVYHALFSGGSLTDEQAVTITSGEYARPVVLLDAQENPFLLYEVKSNAALPGGDLWFVQPDVPTAVWSWESYQ